MTQWSGPVTHQAGTSLFITVAVAVIDDVSVADGVVPPGSMRQRLGRPGVGQGIEGRLQIAGGHHRHEQARRAPGALWRRRANRRAGRRRLGRHVSSGSSRGAHCRTYRLRANEAILSKLMDTAIYSLIQIFDKQSLLFSI